MRVEGSACSTLESRDRIARQSCLEGGQHTVSYRFIYRRVRTLCHAQICPHYQYHLAFFGVARELGMCCVVILVVLVVAGLVL